MSSKKPLIVLAALAATLTAGVAQARGADEVRWSVTIGAPAVVPVYSPAPVYAPALVHVPGVVYTRPVAPPIHPVRYVQPTRRDIDGDGILNRYDRVYNPRWDVDGDGIPNRYDRVYNPRWDRDGDGVPNRRDPRPDVPQRGGWGR